MSLITTTPRKEASKDILCYKLVYMDKEANLWIGGLKGGLTNKEGFPMNVKVDAKGVKQVTITRGRFCLERGFFHSYKQKPIYPLYKAIEQLVDSFVRTYVYCIIPKGTSYYENDDEIASDSIIVFSSKAEYVKYGIERLFRRNLDCKNSIKSHVNNSLK